MTLNSTSVIIKSGTAISVGRSKNDFPNGVTIVTNICNNSEKYLIAKPENIEANMEKLKKITTRKTYHKSPHKI